MKQERNSQRMLNRINKNNKGSSFVLVMVSIALIMILVAVIFVMIFMQYKMVAMGKQSRDNFYYLEKVLDEMRVGVGNESIKQLKSAYDDTVSMVVYYDTNQQKYMNVSDDTASNILNNKFLDNIQKIYMVDKDTLGKLMLSYVQNVNTNLMKTDDDVTIKFDETKFGCYQVISKNPKKLLGYRISGVTVSRVDKKGNDQSISTDLTIYPPKDALNFLASEDDLVNIFSYAMVADYGIEVSGGNNTDIRVVGNIYAAKDTRNNGIYGGTVDADQHKIVGSKSGVETADAQKNESKYSGIFVTGSGTSLNLQSDVVAVNGSIAASDGAIINGNKTEDDSSRATMSNLWTNNLVTLGDNSKLSMMAEYNVSDDLEINGNKNDVNLSGEYYGYNYAVEDDGSEISTSKNDPNKPKMHTNSSAMIINGKEATLDLSQLRKLVINGFSYIDLIRENKTETTGNTNVDIKTAESLSLKSTQLAYRVIESQNITNTLPSLQTTPTKTVGANTNALTTGVPSYNMIKFLTYQFFKDGANQIYTNKSDSVGTNDCYDATWVGKTYEEVWRDIHTNDVKSPYYKGIMDFYFPTNEKIVAKTSSSASDEETVYETNKDGDIMYKRVTNMKRRVTDCYSNSYPIYDNIGAVPTKIAINATSNKSSIVKEKANRYGFLTVGPDFSDISLVKTVVGSAKAVYYFYQFYDEDAKAEFVLDYADYTADKNNAMSDSLKDNSILDTKSIVMPDGGFQYVRGLSAIIDSKDKNPFTLVRSKKGDSGIDAKTLMDTYNSKVMNSKVFKCFLPKAASMIQPLTGTAESMYTDGTRSPSLYTFDTKNENISPLTNPDCVEINWGEIVKHESANGGKGEELKGYNGARVWVSSKNISIDGSAFKNNSTSGIVLCMGDVTIKNLKSFTGTIICAGKLSVTGNTKFYADDQMCNAMLQNDEKNMIRTCFGINEYKDANDTADDAVSVSSIEYTDLVGFDNWIKNGE